MVDFKVTVVKDIAKILLFLVLIAGVLLVLVPILVGVGEKSANALGVENNATVNSTRTMLEATTDAGADLFEFLPWLGVAVIVAGAFGLGQLS